MWQINAGMTVNDIESKLALAGKAVHRGTVFRYLHKLDIQPLGSARPQQYPADSAEKIITHLGLATDSVRPVKTLLARRLVTLSALRRARAAAKGAKR